MNAERVARELRELIDKSGDGAITVHDVLAFAKRRRTSAIYQAIDDAGMWDDKKAAERGRLDFIRERIMTVEYVLRDPKTKEPTRSRLLVSLSEDRKNGGGFRYFGDVVKSEDMRQDLMRTALMELRAFERKYATLERLAPVFHEIRKLEVSERKRKEPQPV